MSILSLIYSPYLRFKNEVTSQDLFKAIALFTMIIDHLGLYFFSQDIDFRIIGRVSMPIWIFFVGYNFKPERPRIDRLLIMSISLTIIMYLLGANIIPLRILFSIFFSRIIVDYYNQYIIPNKKLNLFEWFAIVATCLMFYTSTKCFFEYGTLAFITAIWGYNCRHKIGNIMIQSIIMLIIISAIQITSFHFNLINSIACITLLIPTIFLLHQYQALTFNIQGISKYIINISSRYSLYLYCLHLIIFIYLASAYK
jgi:hypothetical protein